MTPASLATDVVAWGNLKVAPSDAALVRVCEATVAYVSALPVVANATAGEWTETVRLGAVMLAARLYRRRNSPNGLETIGAEGIATYVSRHDSDVARMLRTEVPSVG